MSQEPTHCTRCGIDVGPEHWFWRTDIRYLGGGAWKCREGKRAAGRRHSARVQADPIKLEKKKKSEKEWFQRNTLYSRFKAYVADDKKKGLIALEKTAALALMMEPCFYCKVADAGGLDRRDSSKSHSADNVVPCCMWCNEILGDLPPQAKDLLSQGLREIRSGGFFESWAIPQMRRRA